MSCFRGGVCWGLKMWGFDLDWFRMVGVEGRLEKVHNTCVPCGGRSGERDISCVSVEEKGISCASTRLTVCFLNQSKPFYLISLSKPSRYVIIKPDSPPN